MSVEAQYLYYGPAVVVAAGDEHEVHAQLTYEDRYQNADGELVSAWSGLLLAPAGLPEGSMALRLPSGEQRDLHNVTIQRRERDVVVAFHPPRRHDHRLIAIADQVG